MSHITHLRYVRRESNADKNAISQYPLKNSIIFTNVNCLTEPNKMNIFSGLGSISN
jgi:hypothetical protein